VVVAAQGPEGFFRPVGRGRKSVCSQAYPGQEGDQGELMKDVRVEGIFCVANEPAAEFFEHQGFPIEVKEKP
jgi:hypothetical protein